MQASGQAGMQGGTTPQGVSYAPANVMMQGGKIAQNMVFIQNPSDGSMVMHDMNQMPGHYVTMPIQQTSMQPGVPQFGMVQGSTMVQGGGMVQGNTMVQGSGMVMGGGMAPNTYILVPAYIPEASQEQQQQEPQQQEQQEAHTLQGDASGTGP